MHPIFGFRHDYWLYNVFAAFNLAASIAFLVLGITGVYLWFKMHNERLIGSVILFANLGSALAPNHPDPSSLTSLGWPVRFA